MPLSGREMLALYRKAGWVIAHRKGSHVKLAKGAVRETIPLHKELAAGLQRKFLKRLEESAISPGDQH